MIPVSRSRAGAPKRLLEALDSLSETGRESVVAFAEFLVQREARNADVKPEAPQEPEPFSRPAEESVVGAMKRLSATFHMLERSTLLNEASALMSQHILQGRDAPSVIDDLEALFKRSYEQYLQEWHESHEQR